MAHDVDNSASIGRSNYSSKSTGNSSAGQKITKGAYTYTVTSKGEILQERTSTQSGRTVSSTPGRRGGKVGSSTGRGASSSSGSSDDGADIDAILQANEQSVSTIENLVERITEVGGDIQLKYVDAENPNKGKGCQRCTYNEGRKG